ncbi:MAG: ABC transporter substrate-binding protein [Pseudomonadota bacterium]
MLKLRSFFAALGLSALLTAPAMADAASESFVRDNGTRVLSSLDDPDLNATERADQFSNYMDELSNFNRVSNFVIGKYARRFSPEELAEYRAAFRAYNLAAYQVQFDEYRGSDIIVTGSTDRSETDSIVNSTIRTTDGDELDVRWRVLSRSGNYEVVDVALNIDGQLLWLAIEQRAQFLDLLDRENGSAAALISKLKDLTAELKAELRG